MIEQTILQTTAKDALVTIEPKKIITAKGVKNEIDLYVTFDGVRCYKYIYIFDCKKWIKGVRKNSIIVLSAKIDVTKAQKGFFIAKRFGKHAVAQAKLDDRIELLTASTELDMLPPLITTFHAFNEATSCTDLHFKVIINNHQDLEGHIDTNESRVRLKNEEISYQVFLQHIHDIVKNDVMNHEPTGRFSEGIYPYDITRTFTYQSGELFINEFECRELEAHVAWEAQISYPKIVSQFDVQTRSRIVIQEFDKDKLPPGLDLKARFINIDQ